MKRLVALLLALSLPAQAAQPVARAKVAILPTLAMPAVPVAPPALTATPKTVSPQVQLKVVAPSVQLAAAAFDGAKPPANGGSLTPVPAGEPRPSPSLPPSSGKKSVSKSFKRGLGVTILAATAAPIAWGVYPLDFAAYSLITTLALPVAALAVETAVRVTRWALGKSKPKPAPAKKTLRRAAMAGVLVGLALTAASHLARPVITENMPDWKYSEAVYFESGGLETELRAAMSANPWGADVLDELRDITGRVHMPQFYVGKLETAAASYMPPLDAVVISQETVASMGWTKEEFLKDPAKQREFARKYASLLTHELRHAGQFRRGLSFPSHLPTWRDGELKGWVETEHEAYLTEHWFAFEELKAGRDYDSWELERPLEDLEGYLQGIDGRYSEDIHSDSPYWKKRLERYTKDWDAHRLEAYKLLEKRAIEKGETWKLDGYRKKIEELTASS